MNIVDHPGLGKDARYGIGGGAIDRHSIIEGRAADAASFSPLRKAVDIQRSGAEIVHIGENRDVHVRSDDAVILDELGYRDDRLVRQTDESLIDNAAADKRG